MSIINILVKRLFSLLILIISFSDKALSEDPTNCGCDNKFLAADPEYRICLEECMAEVPVTNELWLLITGGVFLVFFKILIRKNIFTI